MLSQKLEGPWTICDSGENFLGADEMYGGVIKRKMVAGKMPKAFASSIAPDSPSNALKSTFFFIFLLFKPLLNHTKCPA